MPVDKFHQLSGERNPAKEIQSFECQVVCGLRRELEQNLSDELSVHFALLINRTQI